MSFDGERSPKRQRLESYSPASPPVIADTKAFVPQQPQTPPPSVRMSPSWQAQTQTTEARSGPSSVTFPTPPSTAGFVSGQQKSSVGGAEGAGSEQHTPSEQPRDGDGDAEMSDRRDEAAGEGDVSMTGVTSDVERRRNRHVGEEVDAVPDPPPAPLLYSSPAEPIALSRPHPSQNLISLYSLDRLQASVARKDAAGNKINKLRKSYEGKVKALGLEGRSKATVGEAILSGLVDPGWDDEVGPNISRWEEQRGRNPLDQAGAVDDVLARLDAGLGLKPGRLPKAEHENWKNVLSLDEPKAAPAATAKPGFAGTMLGKTAPGMAARASAPSSPRNALRPERTGKKRRYDDSSFDGYAQTFEEDGGYSTGGIDERRNSATKRPKVEQKRKDFSSSSPPFNTGMVGIKSS